MELETNQAELLPGYLASFDGLIGDKRMENGQSHHKRLWCGLAQWANTQSPSVDADGI
jgi:hypothetical protein